MHLKSTVSFRTSYDMKQLMCLFYNSLQVLPFYSIAACATPGQSVTQQDLIHLEVSDLKQPVLPFEISVLQQPKVYGLQFFSVMKLVKDKLRIKKNMTCLCPPSMRILKCILSKIRKKCYVLTENVLKDFKQILGVLKI